MSPTEIEQIVRRVYAAYPAGDRATVEALIADDFRFTSPYDDAIDRAAYFERCWPNHDRMRAIEIHRIVIDRETAFVTYEVMFRDGRRARNTEYLTVARGKLARVEVYFGAARDGTGRFAPMQPA